jgi:hypothetical protein
MKALVDFLSILQTIYKELSFENWYRDAIKFNQDYFNSLNSDLEPQSNIIARVCKSW